MNQQVNQHCRKHRELSRGMRTLATRVEQQCMEVSDLPI